MINNPMHNSEVEILLATYNGERFVKPLLSSLLAQTYRSIRITIRDDGSQDNTLEIIKTMAEGDPRIHLLSDQSNLGVIGNFSHLLERAQGHYLMFADQDDVWLPEKVERTLEKMQEMEHRFGQERPLAVHSDLRVVDRHLNLLSSSFWSYAKLFPLHASCLNRLLVQNVVTGCTLMMNRPLAHLMRPIPDEAIQHDWWAALVAAAFGQIGVINEPTVLYRQHGSNILGASKFSALTYLVQRLSTPCEVFFKYRAKNLSQTKAFLKRYHSLLSPGQLKMITAYCQLLEGRFLTHFHLILQYRFYKNGLARNLISLIPTRKKKDNKDAEV